MINKTLTNEATVLTPGVPTKISLPNAVKPHKASDLPGADEPITYLIDNFMEHGTFNSIIGASKTGKSLFALQMAFCIQNGIPFLGHKTDQSDTLYVDFELKSNHIKQRVDKVKDYYNLPDGDEPNYMSFYEDFSAGRIDFEEIIERVRNQIKANPNIKLVIFDCFYSWCQGARNQEGNVKSQLMPLKTIASDYDISVCYVHHTSKGGVGTNPTQNDIINAAGGSGIHGKIVDTTYVIYPLKNSKTIFMVTSAGRACGCADICCERSAETNFFFYSQDEFSQEITVSESALCKMIVDYIEDTGTVDVRHIRKTFSIDNETLRSFGFLIDTKRNRISFNKDELKLPHDIKNGVDVDAEMTA